MSFRPKPGCGSGTADGGCCGGGRCHVGICAIEFFMSVEVRIKKRTSEPIYDERHVGEKRIVQSLAMIAAADPLTASRCPTENI